MKACPTCNSFFRDDVAFCPFDGQALVPLDDPFVGILLAGKYRIHEKIGEGGMGSVYLAMNVGVERPFAIKILFPDIAGEKTVKQRFLREGKASNIVGHENIVQVYDVGEHDGLLFLVMEFIEGESLEHMIGRQKFLDVRTSIHILKQICDALGLAHMMGVIHRDIKPGNILITQRKDNPLFVKILDFGLAQIVSDPRLTDKGVAIGTPYFMSPEQVLAKDPSPSMDLYSLGCVAFHMLSGEVPFNGKTTADIVLKHLKSPPPPLAGVQESLQRIIFRLLEKDPQQRYHDAYEVLSELGNITTEAIDISEEETVALKAASLKRKADGAARRKESVDPWGSYLKAASKSGSLGKDFTKSLPEMEVLSNELDSLNRVAQEIMKKMESIQQEGMTRQNRMGYALRVLAKDLSSKNAQYFANIAKVSDIETKMKIAVDELFSMVLESKVLVKFAADGKMGEKEADFFIESGDMARRWQDLKHIWMEKKHFLKKNNTEIEDLEFQIKQLKEQLDAGSRETEDQLKSLNEELQQINERKRKIESELSDFARQFGAVSP